MKFYSLATESAHLLSPAQADLRPLFVISFVTLGLSALSLSVSKLYRRLFK